MKRNLAEAVLTAEHLRNILHYNICTGEFTWRHNGMYAGCKKDRYVVIYIGNIPYRAHRLAWLWMTGNWPTEYIDHINLNKQDNRFFNLRPATRSQNNANKSAIPGSASGLKGAHRYRAGDKLGKPWQSSIVVNGRKLYLGQFPTAEQAHAAYQVAAEKHFGEFARSE